MRLSQYLEEMVHKEASDLYLTTGAPPSAKIHGKLQHVNENKLPPNEVKALAYDLMDSEQINAFEESPEMNLAISVPNVGRFRVNIFRQRNQVAMVIRRIEVNIPTPESLSLPPVLKKLIMNKRGLILFVGATGSGKSSSLASLIDYRNANSSGHIITVEDPIEFIHKHKQCIVNQREVGIDTDSYEDALKNTLRQAPDVIMIGEIRDRQTMEHALAYAETGHLAISTLHANNANQAFDRIVNFFPDERRKQILMDLSLNIFAVVSQRLIPGKDGKRVAVFEILTATPLIKDLIFKGEFHELKEIMGKSTNAGMQTFDNSLVKLYMLDKISREDAIRNADSQNNVRLQINLHSDGESLAAAKQANAQKELEELAKNPSVIALAKNGEFQKLNEFTEKKLEYSEKDFDDLLVELYQNKLASFNDIMRNALNREKITRRIGEMGVKSSSNLNLRPLDSF
ncbi:MAG TPA: PilT/PilU family type 4a pilus ATPase [Gammaproteobacteria bacterium]|nr:PilT/PilU family type 4a pilus ATPase [Gammaproteobacteria bacterium]